ncbi:hypothetical protein JK635_07335 [Neobacillus sp. YIM B02564]|uniref:Uncharacterized protein n=1 Tax=Neobacillus paridis TaxID=2803862 RepID=A0ABS1TL33_9BACI|nr:hypothetical protein [Neobacillus paridis]MBL4952021.1 hypothetical protein [Neobacillus paridis]
MTITIREKFLIEKAIERIALTDLSYFTVDIIQRQVEMPMYVIFGVLTEFVKDERLFLHAYLICWHSNLQYLEILKTFDFTWKNEMLFLDLGNEWGKEYKCSVCHKQKAVDPHHLIPVFTFAEELISQKKIPIFLESNK